MTFIYFDELLVKGGVTHQFLGAGDDSGTLHILEVPRVLSRLQKNEVFT